MSRSEFEWCLKKGLIVKVDMNMVMVQKEMEAAAYDLERAVQSFEDGDAKWASVQAYYSMFHAAKGLLLSKGYREKSHRCLVVAIRELMVRSGELDPSYADDLEICMDIRKEADYTLVHENESASICIENAERLLEETKRILGMG